MTQAPPLPAQRLFALDVLRGITIAFMIMVNNNGGSGSWGFMNHADWNGLTATDLVFPTFVFVVGISIVFSCEARLARGVTRAQLARHTLQRAGILFLLGLLVNGFPFFDLAHFRIYGVLQRIALSYLAVGLFYLWDRRVSTKFAALVVALVGYWILLRWVPVPGAGIPGRDFPFMDKTQNLVSWLDRLLMPNHLYLGWTDHNQRDPEGLLSTLPAIGTMLLGLLTALWLRRPQPAPEKATGLVAWCMLCLAAGKFWVIDFPLNKNLWTSSYVLIAAGCSLLLLALTFWIIEVKNWRKYWTWPWLVFGSNAIVAYMFSELLGSLMGAITIGSGAKHASAQAWIFAHTFAHVPNPGWAAFAYSVSFTAVCFLPVWILYRKKIFVKV